MIMKLLSIGTAVLLTVLLLHAPSYSQAPPGGGYGVNAGQDDTGDKQTRSQQEMDKGKTNGGDEKEPAAADRQSDKKADLVLTKKIRQALVKDDSLSMRADNIKIITRYGMVTLKGKVKTADEKNKVREIAAGIAGADKITDSLEIAEQDKK